MTQPYDPVDIQAQARAREEAARAARTALAEEEGDVRWLMSSKRGRRIVWRLLERAGVYRLSFNTNAMTMAFAEGNRNYGLALLDQVHRLCPALLPQMMDENVPKEATSNDD